MKRAKVLFPASLLASLALAVLLIPTESRAADIGYVEDFALAKDRAAALKQLIPGTEDYYYYQTLHALNTGKYDEVAPLLKPWIERHGRTARVNEILVRHALLTYEGDPKKSLAFLTSHLGLQFNHQREVVGAIPNLPTVLDQKLISRSRLKEMSLARWINLENFEDGALDWLASENLNPQRRRNLLHRLRRPDLPNLPSLINDDLNAKNASQFGGIPVHMMLTKSQLDELLKLRPGLINDGNFVRAYVSKLCPGPDSDWKHDRAIARQYLERLEKFTNSLPPVHNSLKAHVLFHRLALDRADGVYDKERFLAYLQLPRFQPYMSRAWNERRESRNFPAHLHVDFSAFTLLPAVAGNGPAIADQELVRSYLQHALLNAKSPAEFEPYIDSTWLSRLFAETKAENGIGDPESWASKLPPAHFAKFKERIDIDFAYTNKSNFAANEPVKLELFIKNAPKLLVKVYEVNTKNFYRAKLKEVDTDINLDGLVANSEKVHRFEASPLRRVARTFEFPQLSRPGVYVIDFISNGKSSRALVRKGRMKPLVSTGTAGQNVVIVDEANQPVPGAIVWMAGVEYRCDKEGRTTLPFTAQPGRRPIVMSSGDFSCFDTIEHQPENYRFTAGIHVDRESLISQRPTQLIVRPALFLNGLPVSLKILEDVRLRIVSLDHSGIASSTEVPDFKLFEDRESTYEFRTPSRLHRLAITLSARVKSLGTGKDVPLSATETFSLNEVERTGKIEDLHFAKFGPNFTIELLGRTGEFKPDRPVQISLKHRDFKEQVAATLKTDPSGRVVLGPLPDIASVTATGPEGTSHSWNLPLDRHTFRSVLHVKAGETATLPYLGSAQKPTRGEFALLEMRGNTFVADRFASLAIQDGLLEARNLPAGDYDLWQKVTGEKIRIRVVDGAPVAGYLLGKLRQLEVPGLKPTQIASIAANDDVVVVKLKDASKFARVHVFATRYLPAFNAFANLAKVRDAELKGVIPTRPESVYLTGRNIGDEYRYVLDRRGLKKYPGIMLDRPQLLLNPWAIRSTEAGEQMAVAGEMFSGRGRATGSVHSGAGGGNASKGWGAATAGADFANLDYLAEPSAQLLNLAADKDGLVRIDRKKLGPHSMLQVLAVDPLSTTVRTVSLPEQAARFVDLRLKDGLDPTEHYTQQKRVTVLKKGQPFVLNDVVSSRFEAYDSLPKLYTLYATLSRDPKLAEFSFILNWPKLKDAEKRSLYSKYACHELHFFLWRKDRPFFESVVRPYLANKKDKTFLDRWLLGQDVAEYLEPFKHGRLNVVEKVLLARRIRGEGDRTARHLSDLFALLPPRLDRDLLLFDTAVQTSELNADRKAVSGELARFKRLKTESELAYSSPPKSIPDTRTDDTVALKAPGLSSDPESRAQPAPSVSAPEPKMPEGKKADKLTKEFAKAKDGRASGKGKVEKEQSAVAGLPDAEDLFFDDARKLGEIRQLYRKLDPTMEWAENNYYKLRASEQQGGLVTVSPFWVNYAGHAGNKPFLSKHLADASRNFTEMMFALSVIDLPFEPAKHLVAFEGSRMNLDPASSIVAFHEEVRLAGAPDGKMPVLVGQNFYKPNDRFRMENGEKLDKYVSGEFLINTVYGCQVVVTNPTSTRQRFSILVQLPTGSIPVANGQFTKTVLVDLEPYRTQTVDYQFYFPRAGKFAHFPAHVAKSERLVAVAPTARIEVLEKPRSIDTGSWDYLSQFGTNEQVLAAMNRENCSALNLDKIAFRMKDRLFFEQAITLLKARHVFNMALWSYGVYHNSPTAAREYFAHHDGLVRQVGGPIDTPLFRFDPVERFAYEHLEYKPLVNARAHSLGNRRQIVNAALGQQYHRLLKTLTYRQTLTDADHLAIVYYFLLQDRIEEAQAAFAHVHPDRVPTRIQYDYFAAHMALYEENPVKARSIAARYLVHPVDRWRNAFASVIHHIDEAEGKGPRVADPDDKGQNQNNLAATEPALDAAVQGRNVNLAWQNLKEVTINYIPMDVELLFSRTPFASQKGGQFAFTRPARSQAVQLPAGKDKVAIPLPDDLQKRNMLVEVVGAGKTRIATYFASDMDVKFTENYGQLKVSDAVSGKPIGKVYVKVYARLANGAVRFHKDGYTDLRGRFDYASVNTPERQPIQRFSVLILSEAKGAVIREVVPPQQ